MVFIFLNKTFHPFVGGVEQRYIEQKFPVFKYNQHDIVLLINTLHGMMNILMLTLLKKLYKKTLILSNVMFDFLEIIPLGYSKATGIQMIADYLNIPVENAISIGDSTNDLPMLEFTKESVAMGNSNPLLFDVVTFITTDIRDNGIENALKHFKNYLKTYLTYK